MSSFDEGNSLGLGRIATVFACGSALFSDGYANAASGPVRYILSTMYPDQYKLHNNGQLFTSMLLSIIAMSAVSGSSPDFPIPQGTLAEFVLSDPFRQDSQWIKQGPSSNAGHHVKGALSEQKAAFINSVTGAQISYARLRQDVGRLASGFKTKLQLQAAKFKPGKRSDAIVSPIVCLHLPNCIPFVVIETAVWAAGLTATTANSALKPAELSYIIASSKPAAIFTLAGEEGLDIVLAAIALLEDKDLARSYKNKIFTVDPEADDYGLNLTASKAIDGVKDWKTVLDLQAPEKTVFPQYTNKGESERRTAVILWSSGTSGKSKGVMISHLALAASVQTLFYGNPDFGRDEVFIGFAPFFHVFGLCNVFLLSIAMGGTTVCMPKFNPVSFLSLAQRYRATAFHIAPPVAVILAKSPMLDGYDLSSVRSATSGGAPLGDAIIEAVWKRLGVLIKMGYGLSETASTTVIPGTVWDDYAPYRGASGVPFPSVEVKIIDVAGGKEGKTVNTDETGEICIRGPSLMNGYLNNPAATEDCMDAQGWFHTGDVGKIDKSGYLYIVDRLKEVIKVRGFQVAPAELEAYLAGHDSVADAGVTGTYSEEEATEYPVAYLVPKDTKLVEACQKAGKATPETIQWVTTVLKYIESKVIDYKWIKGGVIVCEAIPKSNSGKILRKDFKTVQGHRVQIYTPKKHAVRQSKL